MQNTIVFAVNWALLELLQCVAFFNAHPALYALVVWPALTGALNALQVHVAKWFPASAQFMARYGLDTSHVARWLWSKIPGAPPPPTDAGGDSPPREDKGIAVAVKRERLREDRREVARVRALTLVLAGLFAMIVTACTAAAWTVARDATGDACPFVVQSALPQYSQLPICTTLEEIEAAVEAFVLKNGGPRDGVKLSREQSYQAILEYRAAKAGR